MSVFADAYDVAFFDLDGVIYLGADAVEGAVAGVTGLQAAGVRTMYVTNNAARPAQTVADHLVRLGIEASVDDLITSAQAARGMLQAALPAGARVLVAGTQNLKNEIAAAGFEVVTMADDEPAAVIQGYDPDMTWPRLDEAAIAIQRGALWFATNTDSTRPTSRGLVPGAGAAVSSVGNTVPGLTPQVAGKPFRPLLDEAMRRSGAQRPVFVGDRIDTDIAGAGGVDMDSFMVFTGAHGCRDLLAAQPGERPTAIGWGVPDMLRPRREAVVRGMTATCGDVTVTVTDGVASVSGDLATKDQQLDALWALAQLVWAGIAIAVDDLVDQLNLLP